MRKSTLILALVFLVSCSSSSTQDSFSGQQFALDNAHTITLGMGYDEVLTAMQQPPYYVEELRDRATWVWVAADSETEPTVVAVTFENDVVQSVNFSDGAHTKRLYKDSKLDSEAAD